MKTIEEIYNQTIQLLKTNSRALPKYSEDVIENIKMEFELIEWNHLSANDSLEILKKIFCILTNTQTTSAQFHDLLLKSYEQISKQKMKDDLIVMFLAAINKQFIDHSLRTGNLIPFSVIDIFKDLLKNKNPEVIEWVLRSIDSMGIQGLKLEKDVKNLRPSLLKIFNKHQQAAFEIVNHIEKEWMRYKNEKR